MKDFADEKYVPKIELWFGKSRKHSRKGRKCWFPAFSSFPMMIPKAFFPGSLKVDFQIFRRNFYKNTKKSSSYPQSLITSNLKTPEFENHPTTGEIRELLPPRSTPTGITVYIHVSCPFLYKLEIHRRKFQT